MTTVPSTDLLSPDFQDAPFWWRAAPPGTDNCSELPGETDVLVIGSGYAGLSCALELARNGLKVVVIDAQGIGEGASSRAAGFTSGRAGVSKQIDLEAAVGAERATAILEEADEAHEFLQDIIERENIDCDFTLDGRYVGAVTAKSYDKLAVKMAEYNADGRNRFEMVSKPDQGRFIKTDFYHGGMWIKDGGSIHPAKYHAGLVRLCKKAGAKLFGHTRAVEVTDERSHKTVKTSRGTVLAREVMLATGGYTDKVSQWHRERIIPMSSTIIATEDLGADRVKELLPAGMPVIDSKRVISFVRASPDGRHILFGGRARFTPVSAEKSIEILYWQMCQVFPELAGCKVINTWAGFMAFTFDFLPKLGQHNGMHYALACNGGSGIVMMTWLGRRAAMNILGSSNRESAFSGLRFDSRPFYTGNPWFIPFVGTWYRFRDWLDMKSA